jgi:two-component system LytT family response regulator
MKVRALIIEDEVMARTALRDFSARVDWLEIIGEASDGATAVGMIDELCPELVFLDVQMPVFSGIRVLELVRHQPFVVFTTAFDEYAITAFELGALDYLLKPFGIDRFLKSLERVKRHLGVDKNAIGIPVTGKRVADALETAHIKPLVEFFVRDSRGRAVHIRVENILRLSAADDYVEIHTSGGKSYLMNITLNDFERRLDQAVFRRVHRSHIVNLSHIKSIEPYDRRLLLHFSDDSKLVCSRAGAQTLRNVLQP